MAVHVSEREWQRVLADALDALGWAWFHIYPLQTAHGWRTPTTAKGIPDLCCFRGAYTLGIEVKDNRGTVDPQQKVWLTRWSVLAGGRAWVLRPRDDIDQIVAWLRDPQHAPRIYGFEPATI